MRFAQDLTAYGTVEGQPRLEGRNAHVMISPIKKDKAKESKEPRAAKSHAAAAPACAIIL